jgi:hypothetical protein
MTLMEVRVKLSDYLLYRRAVILHHITPTLGLQHYLYPRGALIKVYHLYFSLDDKRLL